MSGSTLPRGNILVTTIFAVSLTPAAVLANTTSEQSFTIQGLQVNDLVNVNINGAQTAGIIIANCRITAANTVAISFGNITGGTLTPVAGSYAFTLDRAENLPLPTNAT